jgi:hypothetical protein
VQFKDELISKKFPPDSGVEATYRFTIEEKVPQPLSIVIERPDLYAVECNGQPVKAEPGQWWLDKAFGRIDITKSAKVGENTVTIKARPFTIYHELEPAYVLGDFSLKAVQKGFAIAPPQPLVAKQAAVLAHGSEIEGTMWLSSGIGYHRDPAGAGNDGAPWVVFDLGQPTDLAAIEVWNYNEQAMARRGVKGLEVSTAATDAADAFKPLGTFELAQGDGLSQKLPAEAKGVRFVRFKVLSNHSGVRYPAKPADAANDNAFVGLSEVRFHQPGGKKIDGVKVAKVSSELRQATHDRRAIHLVDGSGLGGSRTGWNRQGMPFYSAGVAYRQTFDIEKPAGQYKVAVPSWYGSVAKVVVNGKLCGHLAWQPWECDITQAIQPGENRVEIVVIGTLKNTLGPHHAGSGVGSAWPGMFHQGPPDGPPPGQSYHTLGYGLFEPFQLVQTGRCSRGEYPIREWDRGWPR